MGGSLAVPIREIHVSPIRSVFIRGLTPSCAFPLRSLRYLLLTSFGSAVFQVAATGGTGRGRANGQPKLLYSLDFWNGSCYRILAKSLL